MMSIAEVMSMAMASMLVVILKVRRRYGRTYVVGDEILLLVYCCVRKRGFMNDVHVEDGRCVDKADGHHVKVGVGVLPNREGRRCYSGL